MKRFKYLKPIKSKDLFYNEKNSRGMRFKQKSTNVLVYIVLTIISLIWVLPFVYLILQSFAKSYSPQVIIPKEWTLDNYRALFDTNFKMMFNNKEMVFAEVYPFGRWLLNTVLIALVVSVLASATSGLITTILIFGLS